MAEAIQTVAEAEQRAKAPLTAYQAALRARMITATCTLMHQRALQATKFALRARGLKVVEFSHRELGLLAIEYGKRHAEQLLNDAAATIEQWRVEGFFGKRAQRCFVEPLQLAKPAPIRNPRRAAG